MATQIHQRRNIAVGSGQKEVSSVMYWYRNGYFKNAEEAQGAFRLAYQQALDGMGQSIPQWMGLTDDEFSAWHINDTLPTP